MDIAATIKARRSFRSLEKTEITQDIIAELISSASLAPSCFNNQPWRYVFVYERSRLEELKKTLNKGNEWAYDASMIVAVASNKGLDCIVKGREYYLFDAGLSTAFLILSATELGLVAHPIAGYDEARAKMILSIPEEMVLETLIIVGKHSKEIKPILSEKQAKDETTRPSRMNFENFIYHNEYKE
jgi:nitroreductase